MPIQSNSPKRIALIGMPIVFNSNEKVFGSLLEHASKSREWNFVFSGESDVKSIEFLSTIRCDGAIVRLSSPEMVQAVKKIKIPAVNVSNLYSSPHLLTVCVDPHSIARSAADHFIKRGFRRFACVCGSPRDRALGKIFKDHLDEHGFICDTFVLKNDLPSYSTPLTISEEERPLLQEWLQTLNPQVGLYLTEDRLGNDFFKLCKGAGWKVPQQIAVVSSPGRVQICESCDPPLSAVDVEFHEVGRQAALYLDRMMAGERFFEKQVTVSTDRVVARQSTETYAAENPEIERALNCIYEELEKGINASDVIHRLSMPRRSFYRLFKETTGLSPKEFIQERRIQRAMNMIGSGAGSLKVVAKECGFSNRLFMLKLIRKKIGSKEFEGFFSKVRDQINLDDL